MNPRPSSKQTDQQAAQTAVEAGLRYVRDDTPGIRRVRAGRGFRYVNAAGKTVRDRHTLDRIRALVIPPAWTSVWICPIANGHLQATGRDARGRKQHRYHERWREVRDENKYGRMLAFGRDLPRIRRLIRRHLAVPGLPRNKVLAAIVNLLEISLIRVGNEEYVRENGSFGLTTFRNRHAKVRGAVLRFQFRGKSHVQHTVEIEDRRLARIVKRCQDLPGQKLFQYLDEEGHKHPIDSDDVNAFVRELSGKDYTAKDYRTWAGTLLAIEALRAFPNCASKTAAQRNVCQAIKEVARQLGNTAAVCRKCYIHPAVIEAYLSGRLSNGTTGLPHPRGLRANEAALLALLRPSRKARSK